MARNRGEPFAKNEKNRAEISSDGEGGEKCESRRTEVRDDGPK